MSGGPSLKGKGGLVGFRRSLKAKGGLVGFRKNLRFKGGLLVFRRFKKLLLLFRSSRKPFSRPIYKKIKHIF